MEKNNNKTESLASTHRWSSVYVQCRRPSSHSLHVSLFTLISWQWRLLFQLNQPDFSMSAISQTCHCCHVLLSAIVSCQSSAKSLQSSSPHHPPVHHIQCPGLPRNIQIPAIPFIPSPLSKLHQGGFPYYSQLHLPFENMMTSQWGLIGDQAMQVMQLYLQANQY